MVYVRPSRSKAAIAARAAAKAAGSSPSPQSTGPKKQYLGIARDHSGSMDRLTHKAMQDYNDNLVAVKANAVNTGIKTFLSTVRFGIYNNQSSSWSANRGLVSKVAGVDFETVLQHIDLVNPITSYPAQGQTPMLDAIGELIENFESVYDAQDPDVGFLIMVITDGAENCSRKWNWSTLSAKMAKLQATGHWSFVFRVPHGAARDLIYRGIPAENILEWEQTERGVEIASAATTKGMGAYYMARSAGATQTNRFYADTSQLKTASVKRALFDVSHEVNVWPVSSADDGRQIRDFVEARLPRGTVYKKGCAFYQLTKTEVVQAQKVFALREKSTGKFYGGDDARHLLNLPSGKEIKLVPGDHGLYDVYVQSTSVNRKVTSGSNILYWKNAS